MDRSLILSRIRTVAATVLGAALLFLTSACGAC